MAAFKKLVLFILFYLLLSLYSILYAQIMTTVAGGATGHGGYWGDGGPATAAQIGAFGGIAIDDYGNLYIGDGNNNRIRKVNSITGIISTYAGTGISGYNGDGIAATVAKLTNPNYVAVDPNNNLYIGDGNYRIRKVDFLTGIISTYAGTGVAGYSGDGGLATAAQLRIAAFAFDKFGNFYMEDGENRRIRKIDNAGIITTIAGNGMSGNSGDGGLASAALINISLGLGTDADGNIYMTDSSASIRKIDVSTGIISRVAGTGDNIYMPYLGDGIPATNEHMDPYGVVIDVTGNIYIVDATSERIEKVNTSGIIATVAGNGIAGYSGDGGAATSARINYPEGIALDHCGNIFIADFGNYVVRKVTYIPSCDSLISLGNIVINNIVSELNIYPNPTKDFLNINADEVINNITVSNLVGQILINEDYNTDKVKMSIQQLSDGIYIMMIKKNKGIGMAKIVKL